jgi:hypothetical protein
VGKGKILLDKAAQGIGWWDKTYTKCIIGGIGNGLSKFHVTFPWDADGKVDLKSGRYSNEEKSALKVKCEKIVQLCPNCAALHSKDGSKVGK